MRVSHAPDHWFSANALARRTKQAPGEADRTWAHLVSNGIPAKQKMTAEQPETVKVDRAFVFHHEMPASHWRRSPQPSRSDPRHVAFQVRELGLARLRFRACDDNAVERA